MSRLKAQVRDARSLSVSLMTDMYSLYEEYYEATSEKRFFQDLADRDHAIILTDRKDVLRGFSTLAVHSFRYEHAPHRAIFSGDTIINHAYWRGQALAFAWARLAGQIKAQEQAVPLYWLLIVKGHRTYHYLPGFSWRFHPDCKCQTPPREQLQIEFLSIRYFLWQLLPTDRIASLSLLTGTPQVTVGQGVRQGYEEAGRAVFSRAKSRLFQGNA